MSGARKSGRARPLDGLDGWTSLALLDCVPRGFAFPTAFGFWVGAFKWANTAKNHVREWAALMGPSGCRILRAYCTLDLAMAKVTSGSRIDGPITRPLASDPWVRLLGHGGIGESSIREFLGGYGASLGLSGVVWIGDHGPVLAHGVGARDLWQCRGRGLAPGEIRWTPSALQPGLDPTLVEGWVRTPLHAARQGRLRFRLPSDRAKGMGPLEWVQAVALAVEWIEGLESKKREAGTLALGLRSAALAHDLRNRLTLASLHYGRGQMEGGLHSGETERLLHEARAMCAAFVPEEGGSSMPTRIELRPLLLRTANQSAAMVRTGGGARLRVRCRPDVWVEADPVLLARVVENLVVNALEASASSQVVSCEGRRIHGGVELLVEDSGRGMDPEGLQRAFRPGASGSHGTGYGSVSLLSALESMDGELRVDSAPGQGTRCRVVLPKVVERLNRVLVHPDPHGRRRILRLWKRRGMGAVGYGQCGAALATMAERPVGELVLARGLVDGRLQDLVSLAEAQGVGVRTLGVKGV